MKVKKILREVIEAAAVIILAPAIVLALLGMVAWVWTFRIFAEITDGRRRDERGKERR